MSCLASYPNKPSKGMAFLFLLSCLAVTTSAAPTGSPWSGNMHPQINFPPHCNITITNDCAPSYAALNSSNALWSCPTGLATSDTCGSTTQCMVGEGDDNPVCHNLTPDQPCCCPKVGCAVTPYYNFIIGVCKGSSCACGSTKTTAPSCGAGSGRCDSKCTGPLVACCFGTDVTPLVPYYEEGSHAKINYLASYNFNPTSKQWEIDQPSSFNTDAKFPTYDLLKAYGGLPEEQAWLAPQPGGSVFWSLGYYPAGVKGVGGQGGVMFVMSTEDWFGGTWYMLNQLSLDRGPGASYPKEGCLNGVNDNCWASGNAGEMDFLEPGWNNAKTAEMDYRQSFSTQNNQMGRCFNGGINSGGFDSPNYLLTEPSPLSPDFTPEPTIYVAVVDSVGNWVYRIPASQIDSIWPGLGRTTAAATLQSAPSITPSSVNPGNTTYGLAFTSNCQAKTVADAHAFQCEFNGEQGFCGNVFASFVNTNQPLFPNASCDKDVRGGTPMPWCKCMVNKGGC